VPIVIRKKVGTVADPIVPELVPDALPSGLPARTPEEIKAIRENLIKFARALARDHARAEHKRATGG
jgi:hypothetical protein